MPLAVRAQAAVVQDGKRNHREGVMRLNTRERHALDAARWPKGASLGDLHPAGKKTVEGLIERGLIEQFVAETTGHPRYRTTAAGNEALKVPILPKARTTRAKLTMLGPRVPTMDTRKVKPSKVKR